MAQRFVLGPEHDEDRVDKVLASLLPDVSRSTIQRWIGQDRVLIGGRTCRARDRVVSGDVIEVDPGPPPPSDVEPDPSVAFGVLHEDPHLVVVDKPAGLVVHPGRGHHEGTLVAGLLARPGFERPPSDPRDPEGRLRPGIVQRLDRDTSGVLVVAKDASTREGLKEQLSEHRMTRAYVAITVGVPTASKIETLHARHPTSRTKFTSRIEEGRVAVTHVTVDERLASGRAALVTCRLETGRTHQIRVHLAEQARTPILADALYGAAPSDPRLRIIADELGRQALHARLLGFVHPATGESLRFESPLPDDFATALERLRDL